MRNRCLWIVMVLVLVAAAIGTVMQQRAARAADLAGTRRALVDDYVRFSTDVLAFRLHSAGDDEAATKLMTQTGRILKDKEQLAPLEDDLRPILPEKEGAPANPEAVNKFLHVKLDELLTVDLKEVSAALNNPDFQPKGHLPSPPFRKRR